MVRSVSYLLAAILCFCSTAVAVDGLECLLDIYQYDGSAQEDVLLVSDTVTFVKDITASGFVGPLSIEFDLTDTDTSRAEFSVHVTTLGPLANTYARSFVVEYSLPARIGDIRGKGDARYSLVMTPVRPLAVDTSTCSFDHRRRGTFDFVPSAHMDIYYVPTSLGDFYWDSVKELMESFYRRFQAFGNFTLPGKILVHLCPCPLHSVIWDKRFGMSVDPTRNVAFALYSKDVNTADPFIVTHTAIMRNFGYAPPFLTEGLANYFSFAVFDMKEILSEGRAPRLEDILPTCNYFRVDPQVADRVSATFVAFLINRYDLERFLRLYAVADDLNLKSEIEQVYGRSIADLDAEWRHYVDTVTIMSQDYVAFAGLAEQMMDYVLMLKYSQAFLDVAKNQTDSIRALSLLKRAYFFNGDYYRTTDIQRMLIDIDSSVATYWMALGTYRMMNGYYEEAHRCLIRARSLDSTDRVVNFNLALNYLYRDDQGTAREILLSNLSDQKGASAQGETRIILANILKASDDNTQQELADQYYRGTIDVFRQSLQIRSSSSSLYMWLGIAFLGLDDVESAINHLEIALFLETRPFYLGMINLWLGKAYEASGEKETARDHFAAVLSLSSADYHQREARKCLE